VRKPFCDKIMVMGVYETWVLAPGMLGDYEVSDLGNVRRCTIGKNTWVGRIVKLSVHGPYGHLFLVRNGISGRKEKFYVHRLVALAFLGGSELEVRHLNGDAGDNTLPNIRWGTSRENSFDVTRMGRNVNANKTHCPKGHPYSGDNLLYTKRKARPGVTERVCKACTTHRRYEGITEGDSAHGTRSGYMKGCRCNPCHTARIAYDRNWRAKRVQN